MFGGGVLMPEVDLKPIILKPKFDRVYVIIIAAALVALMFLGYSSFAFDLDTTPVGAMLTPLLFFSVIILAIILLAIVFFKFLALNYKVTEEEVVMSEGIITKTVRSVPMKKVDNITTKRSLRDLVLGTGSILIETSAGGTGAEITMHYIELHKMNQAIKMIKYLIGQIDKPPKELVKKEKDENGGGEQEPVSFYEDKPELFPSEFEETFGGSDELESGAEEEEKPSVSEMVIKKLDQEKPAKRTNSSRKKKSAGKKKPKKKTSKRKKNK